MALAKTKSPANDSILKALERSNNRRDFLRLAFGVGAGGLAVGSIGFVPIAQAITIGDSPDRVVFLEGSAPGDPGSGKVSIHAESDHKVYKTVAGGAKTELGAGAGSGDMLASTYDPDVDGVIDPAQGGTGLNTADWLVKTADVIVYISGANTVAVNGTTGTIISSNTDASTVIQAAVNALTAGGSIYIKAGIYNLTTTITLPYGLSFYFYGDGIPSFLYNMVTVETYTTPTDGTQIRGPASFLTQGSTVALFQRASGSRAQGALAFFNMAIMPPWGTTTGSSKIYGIYDQYSALFIEDNLMFVPWGWTEAGKPIPTGTSGNNYIFAQGLNCGGVGGGTEMRMGQLIYAGLGQAGTLEGADDIIIESLTMFKLHYGHIFNGIWHNEIKKLSCYDCLNFRAQFNCTRGNIVRRVQIENANVNPAVAYIFYLPGTTKVLTVEYVWNWPTAYSHNITSITDDDSQLESASIAYNMGDSGLLQSFPNIAAPLANTTCYGTKITGPAGETLAFGDFLYPKSDGKWYKAKADVVGTMPVMGMCADAAGIASAASGNILLVYSAGTARYDSWAWSAGSLLYVSAATAGALTHTQPAGSGNQVQAVGIALTATVVLFPAPVLLEIA